MTRVANTVTRKPQMRVGIGGNVYVISSSKLELKSVCMQLEFEPQRIYTSEVHECFVLRFKRQSYKAKVREFFQGQP